MSKKLDLALDNYTKVFKKMKEFQEDNKKVFQASQALSETLTDFGEQLKTIAREDGATENKFFKVKVSIPYKKWYDPEIVLNMATPKERKAIEDTALKAEIDNEKFELLIKDGLVRTEIKQEAFREKAQTARVTIEEIKEK